MQTLTQRAVALAQPASLALKGQDPEKCIHELDSHIKRVETIRNGLFPCEITDHQESQRQLDALQLQRRIFISGRLAHILDMPIMSTAPFLWRDSRGMPKMLPFNLQSDRARIPEHDRYMPGCVCSFYNDVADRLETMSAKSRRTDSWVAWVCGSSAWLIGILATWVCTRNLNANDRGFTLVFLAGIMGGVVSAGIGLGLSVLWKKYINYRREFHIEARFTGVIPARVRRRMHEVKGLFDDVFLLAEVPRIKILSTPKPAPPLPPDPLVIGWMRGTPGTFFLVDQFETTTLEQYCATEIMPSNPADIQG